MKKFFSLFAAVLFAGSIMAADAITCAAAAEAAKGGSTDKVTVRGYVTNIAFAWKDGSMSFWMADTKDGGKVFEAYKCECAQADAPGLGDLVEATGNLTMYQTTAELAAGCTVEIVERAEVVEAKNLGEKTIAEFLELKNTVDTCILTGIVDNITNDKFGNFDLVELGNPEVKVYVYGLLTPAGEKQKFAELGVAAGDTLTVLAVYKEFNNKPEAENAIFVSVKKKAVEPGEEIEVNIHSGLMWYDLVDSYGFWQLVNEQLSISNTESDEVAGTYNVGTDLDDEWTYLVPESGDTVRFVSGSLVVAVADNGDVTITGSMVGDDGNTYKFDLFYSEPKPEKTVNISIPDWDLDDTYLDYGLFALAGEAENGDYVQIALWMPEDAADIYGEYTDEDLDDQYLGSWLEIGEEELYIFSATIKIEEGAEGRALVTAELLCYNNTLYKVTTLVGEGYDYIYGSKKAIKSIMNGQLIIEKNGVRYNANGAVIR